MEVVIEKDTELETFPSLNSRLALVCESAGDPEPTITWFKDDREIPGAISRTLVISEMELSNRGTYFCRAENFDPNKPQSPENKFEKKSNEIIVNIDGNIS